MKGQERTTSTDNHTDICEAVAARLPHLQHVRLRLVRCCEKLFVPPDTLRTMVFSTISPFGCSDVRQCGNRSHDITAGNRYNSEVCDATRNVLVESALRVLDKLPRLEKLKIIDQQAGEDGSLTLMNVREIKAARTLSLPLLFLHRWVESHSQVNLRLPTPDDAARDVVGLITGVEQAAEGHIWATTSTGSRFPIAYRGAPQGRAHQWVKLHAYETKEEYISNRDGQMIGLWQDEEDMGRPLMAARETEGLGKANPIFKEKTPRELQWEQEEQERVELEESDDDMRIDPFD